MRPIPLRLAALATGLALGTFGLSTPAHAAAVAIPLTWQVGGHTATPQEVSDFWTLENLRFANAAGHQPAAVSQGHDDALSSPTPKTGLSGRTVGKIFSLKSTNAPEITDHLLRTTCSGNVVNSANKSVVLSAGHCVKTEVPNPNSGSGQPATLQEFILNGVFIPGFDGSTLDAKAAANPNGQVDSAIAPYGMWVITKVWVTDTWNTAPYFAFGQDMSALTVVKPGGPLPIQDVTGGQQVAFDQPRAAVTTAIGYPQDNTRFWYHPFRNGVVPNPPDPTIALADHGVPAGDRRENDGKVMLQAVGTSRQGNWPYLDPRMAAALGAGASGGPWFQQYDPATGAGVQTGVSSKNESPAGGIAAWSEGPDLVATYFESQEKQAYDAAAATP
ncbi:hypothetical protein [Actinocorallia longicatena]|uniref:Peptidase n=1 Tax=Actinocorallia longicatena TaxID=111803 RepID=A0ABP6QKD1_9ACTN